MWWRRGRGRGHSEGLAVAGVRSGIFLESTGQQQQEQQEQEQQALAGTGRHWQHWLPMAGFRLLRSFANPGTPKEDGQLPGPNGLALSSCICGRADGRPSSGSPSIACPSPTPQQPGPNQCQRDGGPLHQEPGRFGLKRRGPLIAFWRALVWPSASLVKACVSRLSTTQLGLRQCGVL
jgi:hypothetical protein